MKRTCTVIFDGGLDFLEFILDKRILPFCTLDKHPKQYEINLLITVSVVVGQYLKCFGLFSLADQPTRRLGREEDKCKLNNGRNALKQGGETPCPCAVDLECTICSPSSTEELL